MQRSASWQRAGLLEVERPPRFVSRGGEKLATALAAPDFKDPASANYHGRWIDTHSFIDRTLWLELCKEVDAYTFSYYFSKDRGGPLKAFPLWDTDRSLGNAQESQEDLFSIQNSRKNRLGGLAALQDPELFVKKKKEENERYENLVRKNEDEGPKKKKRIKLGY